MQILEQCKTKAYNRLTISKGGRSYGNCFVTVRVDEDTAPQLTSWKISASISHQSRAFYRQIVREQRIPHA